MTSRCVCGSVSVTVKAKPDYIFDCNCSLCRKSGGAWGYFLSGDVTVTGKTRPLSREDKAAPKVEIHSCVRCAATTHFELTPSYQAKHPDVDQVGVNMRLFDPEELVGVDVFYPNGKEWSGEGPFGFRRDGLKISPELPW